LSLPSFGSFFSFFNISVFTVFIGGGVVNARNTPRLVKKLILRFLKQMNLKQIQD
jgi:hypothetical protein